jgi:RNA polymerase sigma factor (TIGR02999 family)
MTELSGEVTLLLRELKRGDKDALERLIPLVYGELRRIAGYFLQGERAGHTLQATALVHEAYLRLAGQDRVDWHNRPHFMGVAANLMRRILVDYARARGAAKRASIVAIADPETWQAGIDAAQTDQILAVDEALGRFAALDPQQARVVELRYFGGMTVDETAEATGISERTVKREWAMASAWLRSELSASATP